MKQAATQAYHITRISLNAVVGWGVILGWLALLVILPNWPASWWYSLNSVIVTNEYVGNKRLIQVDREIHRAFFGQWYVETQIKLAAGYATVQRCAGQDWYRPDKSMPDHVTIDWWMGTNCTLAGGFDSVPVGEYRLCTWVVINTDYFPDKVVHRCSPDYTYKG